MPQPKISIIVNFYNSGKYIPTLLKSVINQSFPDWELIAVDDCSPNHDDKIISKFFKKIGRSSFNVKIIRNPINYGISKSKGIGLNAAQGKYVLYMDGDDWLEKDALSNLIAPAIKYDLDLVIGNHYRVLSSIGLKSLKKSNPSAINKVLMGEECRDCWKHFLTAQGINSVAYWAKLYKREVILKSEWQPQSSYEVEDHKFNCTIFPYVKSLMFIDAPVYYWRWGGLTSGIKSSQESWNFIEKYCDLYMYKKNLLKEFDSEDMLPLIRRILIDYFYLTLSKIAKISPTSPKAMKIKQKIKKLLEHPALRDAAIMNDKAERFEVIRNNDVEEIYYMLHSIYKASWKRRLELRLMQLLTHPLALINKR